MKWLCKYPQRAYPYESAALTPELEYELLDTGVFKDNRNFDVFVEYAKESPEDILIRVTIWNRDPTPPLPDPWLRPGCPLGARNQRSRTKRRECRLRLPPGTRGALALLRWSASTSLDGERDEPRADFSQTERVSVRKGRPSRLMFVRPTPPPRRPPS